MIGTGACARQTRAAVQWPRTRRARCRRRVHKPTHTTTTALPERPHRLRWGRRGGTRLLAQRPAGPHPSLRSGVPRAVA
eukprot:scaffold523_cov101-Isochrysis_galbana.AAC.1